MVLVVLFRVIMSNKFKVAGIVVLSISVMVLTWLYVRDLNFQVFNAKGIIAAKERDLIITATLLMLLIIVPVLFMALFIPWRYRATNTKARYTPDWDSNRLYESLWWGLPILIILVLSVIIVRSSHELDPFKRLTSTKTPVTIQVVATEWKWLFIYPDERIATINYIQFPEDTPINFQITSDASMNSFWIPQLGGQIYAMTGMSTKLHLMASETGSFRGSSANLSGEGFAGMKFTAKSSSRADYNSWVDEVKRSKNKLTIDEYARLAEPTKNNPTKYFGWEDQALYSTIINKYLEPTIMQEKAIQDTTGRGENGATHY